MVLQPSIKKKNKNSLYYIKLTKTTYKATMI